MSFKQALAKIQDCTLIQIFLQFIQNFHLQYQKISKEISYKCYEANWIMASTKATGYGRNQAQAYKHALRNLIELLVEEQQYQSYFRHAFQELGVLSKKMTIKQQIKTELSQIKLQKTNYLKESQIVNNYNNNSNTQNYYNINHSKGYFRKDGGGQKQLSRNQSFKTSSHSTANNNNNNHNNHTGNGIVGVLNQSYHPQQSQQSQQQQIHYSKIQLNKSICSNTSKYQNQQNKNAIYTQSSLGYTDQLSRAKQKLRTLQIELVKVNKQNQILRQRLNIEANYNQCASTLPSKLDSDQSQKLKLKPSNMNTYNISMGNISNINKCNQNQNQNLNYIQNQNQMEMQIQKSPVKPGHILHFNKIQSLNLNVPKLKLQLLPNYHKKSQKSLNQSLLAVYQEKYSVKKFC